MTAPAGFDLSDATQLMAICASVNMNSTGVRPPPATPMPFPNPPPPDQLGWTLAASPNRAVDDDNYWQIWRRSSDAATYALCFRGTVASFSSVWENLHLPSTAAAITVGGNSVPLALNPRALVHSGYAGGLAAMLNNELLDALASAAEAGAGGGTPMRHLFVTGHSQGAAIATLCHSFLMYQQLRPVLRDVHVQGYFFAQPKPGNLHYAHDFSLVTAARGPGTSRGYRVVNDQDWIPETPLSLELPSDLSPPNLFTVPVPKTLSFVHWLLQLFLGPKWRLAYASVGVPVVLRGTPGANPQAPDDILWQHHAQRYYAMLTQAGDAW